MRSMRAARTACGFTSSRGTDCRRAPYGVAGNPLHEDYIPGGSSSGSAVAVAAGLASFALGTDTAGSGRVQQHRGAEALRGLVSVRGVVPACRTLDCVSIFALEISDALRALKVMPVPDAGDAYSRALPAGVSLEAVADLPEGLKAGAPLPAQREFLGDDEARRVYESGLARIEEMGVSVEEIDFHRSTRRRTSYAEDPGWRSGWRRLKNFFRKNLNLFIPSRGS